MNMRFTLCKVDKQYQPQIITQLAHLKNHLYSVKIIYQHVIISSGKITQPPGYYYILAYVFV